MSERSRRQPQLSIPLENLRRDLRTRLESDKQMSSAWAIVPLLPIIVGIVVVVIIFAAIFSAIGSVGPSGTTTMGSAALGAALFGSIFLLYFLYFVVLILVALMVFKMVSRRNTHFNRQILLQEDIISMAKEMSAKRGVDVSILLNNMDRSVREARLEEVEKNATLWAILVFVSGLAYRNPPIPDRSFALYFVLSLITGSIFAVYWVYVLVSDPNNHFRQQMLMEDTIMAQLSGTPAPAATPTPAPLPN